MGEEEAPGGYVRLLVSLDREPGMEGPDEEWLWAEPLGADRYRIESSPFFAYGLSYGDLVRADPGESMPRLTGIERKSGHRTLRVALDDPWDIDHRDVQEQLDGFLELGCTYEAMPPRIVALDVPPEIDVAAVIERLQERVGAGMLVWEWADPRPS